MWPLSIDSFGHETHLTFCRTSQPAQRKGWGGLGAEVILTQPVSGRANLEPASLSPAAGPWATVPSPRPSDGGGRGCHGLDSTPPPQIRVLRQNLRTWPYLETGS